MYAAKEVKCPYRRSLRWGCKVRGAGRNYLKGCCLWLQSVCSKLEAESGLAKKLRGNAAADKVLKRLGLGGDTSFVRSLAVRSLGLLSTTVADEDQQESYGSGIFGAVQRLLGQEVNDKKAPPRGDVVGVMRLLVPHLKAVVSRHYP